jgi:hypothetical protein
MRYSLMYLQHDDGEDQEPQGGIELFDAEPEHGFSPSRRGKMMEPEPVQRIFGAPPASGGGLGASKHVIRQHARLELGDQLWGLAIR